MAMTSLGDENFLAALQSYRPTIMYVVFVYS